MIYGQLLKKYKQESLRFHIDEPLVIQKMANTIFAAMPLSSEHSFVIVCIGSDRSTGDSLGPLVGTKLKERSCSLFSVYGTLDSPVHAKNLVETLQYINEVHKDPFIIAVDACLGKSKSIGYMTVASGPVKPGAALQKQLPPVGDIHMTGIVNVSGYMEMLVLQNTRLSLVMNMAEAISRALWRTGVWMEKQQDVLLANNNEKLLF